MDNNHLDRAGLLNLAHRLPHEDVVTMAGTVRIRGMSVAERDQWESENSRRKGEKLSPQLRARLLLRCCTDQYGASLFSPADLPELESLPAAVVEPLVDASLRLSGMTERAGEDAKKNSEPITLPAS